MKLSKNNIIELMQNGFVLVQTFDRMYGKYYYLFKDGKFIWNLDKRCISTIIKESDKKLINTNTFEYSLK